MVYKLRKTIFIVFQIFIVDRRCFTIVKHLKIELLIYKWNIIILSK